MNLELRNRLLSLAASASGSVPDVRWERTAKGAEHTVGGLKVTVFVEGENDEFIGIELVSLRDQKRFFRRGMGVRGGPTHPWPYPRWRGDAFAYLGDCIREALRLMKSPTELLALVRGSG